MNIYMEKIFHYSDYLITGLIALMIGSVLATWIFLPYKGIADNRIKVYGSKDINIEKVTELLSESPIKGQQTVHFFLIPRWLMVMINPLQGIKSQGFNYPIVNFVFANQDANIDTARTLEGVVAHETTHTDINEKFGFKTFFYDGWKIEGVCDYVSKETSIFPKDVESVLNKYHNKEDLTGKEKYLIYKMKVQKLVDQGKTLEEVITKDVEEPKV